MALIKLPKAQVEVPVTANLRQSEGEATIDVAMHVIYVRHSIKKRVDIMDKVNSKKLTDAALLKADVVDIRGLVDDAGNPVKYSKSVIDEMCEWEDYLSPMIAGWFAVQFGDKAAALVKNSNGPANAGQDKP